MMRSLPSFFLFLCLTALSLPPGAQAGNESASTAPKATPLTGKILETMDGGGYTYVLLGNGNEKKWVAMPLMKVSVGQQVTLQPGFEMDNFSSKALNRKFDKVYFSGGPTQQPPGLTVEALQKSHKGISTEKLDAALKKNEKAIPAAVTVAAPSTGKEEKPVKGAKLTKAKGPNAYSIAELFAKRAKLDGRSVTVRGTVVKVSSGIMKRNWIHLKDGTGVASKKTNEVVVTSTTVPDEGQVITARGILHANKDFGAGYRYDVIIEEAQISH